MVEDLVLEPEAEGAEIGPREDRGLFESIRDFAAACSAFPVGSDVYQLVAEKLWELFGAFAVSVATVDVRTRTFVVRHVAARPGVMARTLSIVNEPFLLRQLPLNGLLIDDLFTNPIRELPGLFEATFGLIPRAACAAAERMFRLDAFVRFALRHGGETVGVIVVVSRSKRPRLSTTLGAVIADVASLAIEERESREALRESDERYRMLFEHSADAVMLTDPDGFILYANQSACRLFGYTEEELRKVGRSGAVDHSDPRLPEAIAERSRSGIFSGVLTHVRKDGSRFEGAVTTTVFAYREGHQRASTIVRDVSKAILESSTLKEIADHYRGLVEAAMVGVFRSTREGRLLYANPAFVRMLGYDDPVELYAIPLEELYRFPEDRARLMATLESEGRLSQHEIELVGARGEPLTFLESVSLSNGLVSGVVIDITERKRMEHTLRAAQTRLRHLSHRLLKAQESERRAVARELHDEIGQVLTVGKIELEAIRGRLEEPAMTQRLQETIAALDRCLRQVRSLSLELHPPILDDLGLVVALRWEVERFASRSNVAAKLSADELPHDISKELVEGCFRIAQEALTNVMRHAQANNVNLELRLVGREIRMKIHDDGCGFDVGRVSRSTSDEASFGMVGMQERANLLGGLVEIASTPGKGTTISARIPVSRSGVRKR